VYKITSQTKYFDGSGHLHPGPPLVVAAVNVLDRDFPVFKSKGNGSLLPVSSVLTGSGNKSYSFRLRTCLNGYERKSGVFDLFQRAKSLN